MWGVIEYIYEYLTNWNFSTNIVKNIIWHLLAGEPHQDVKITVTYYLPAHTAVRFGTPIFVICGWIFLTLSLSSSSCSVR